MKRKMITLMFTVMVGTNLLAAIPAVAADTSLYKSGVQATAEVIIVPFKDVIKIMTRFYKGKHQYRRWNATHNYWVDKNWIDF